MRDVAAGNLHNAGAQHLRFRLAFAFLLSLSWKIQQEKHEGNKEAGALCANHLYEIVLCDPHVIVFTDWIQLQGCRI